MIIFALTFLGVVVGMGCILFIPVVAEIVGSERMRSWIKESPAKADN